MKVYQTNTSKLAGTDIREVHRKAFTIYNRIKSHSKRRPYIRSAYFSKNKIFLGLFWEHLVSRNFRDKIRRLKYYPCAIDLIRNSKFKPTTKQNPNKPDELLHRFAGVTKDNEIFIVQIKEDTRSDQKWLLSVFPKDL